MVVMAVVVPTVFPVVFFVVFFVFVFRWSVLVMPWPRHVAAAVTAVVMATPTIVIAVAVVTDGIMNPAIGPHYNITILTRYSHYNLRFGCCGYGCHCRQEHQHRQGDGDKDTRFHSCFFFNNADFTPKVDTRRKFPSYGKMRRA